MWGLGVLIPLLAAGALRVIQEPDELQVTEGDTARLGCRVEVAESSAQLRMEWVRDGELGVLCATRLPFVTPTPFVIPTPPSPCPRRVPEVQLAWHPPRATLSLPQVRGNDSGRYICQVILEIPWHRIATGNGTELRVTPAAALGGHQTALLWGLVGSLGGSVLLLGVALLGYRCCRRSADTAIYLNVVSSSARDPKKPPPPEPQHNLYPPLPPRP